MYNPIALFYQDINEQFEGYTQHLLDVYILQPSCFIRISMNNLKDIHNFIIHLARDQFVVLSGYQ